MAIFGRRNTILFLVACVTLIITLIVKLHLFHPSLQMYKHLGLIRQRMEVYKLECSNVLERMVVGYWERNDFSQDEMDEIENFHRKVRTFQGIPQSLQRKDGRCGNVHFEREIIEPGLNWFRALCDPEDSRPCCFEHQCQAKSVEMCGCDQCYDVRQQIQAELSTWTPADPACQYYKEDRTLCTACGCSIRDVLIVRFLGEHDTCKLLAGMTIFFMGDSFMRELFVAVLDLIGVNSRHGAFKKQTPRKMLEVCDRFYRATGECKSFIANDVRECHNTTRLKRVIYRKARETSRIMSLIEELQRVPNSLVIFGPGIHEGYNVTIVENEIVEPILQLLSKSPWPKPIWLATHSPGLLKAPKFSDQQLENVVAFNLRMNALLRARGVPVLDFFQLTKGVMSYDGTHYGPGVNDVKAQIFLNYILEMKLNMALI